MDQLSSTGLKTKVPVTKHGFLTFSEVPGYLIWQSLAPSESFPLLVLRFPNTFFRKERFGELSSKQVRQKSHYGKISNKRKDKINRSLKLELMKR
jgi:hypothetical protein